MVTQLVEAVGVKMLDALQEWGTTELPSAYGDVYERSWSEELATALKEQEIDTQHQQLYPGSRWSCDLVVALPNHDELWIEIKGAWSVIASNIGSGSPKYRRNSNFRKHLFHPRESALKDLTIKLPTIFGPNRHGAVLLIGYELNADPMDDAIAELNQFAGLDKPEWGTLTRSWTNPFDSSHRCRCWFWHRLGWNHSQYGLMN